MYITSIAPVLIALWCTTVSTVAVTEAPNSEPSQTCNTCCKGESGSAGINGFPGVGVPGNNGLPGRDGRDGRDGLKGDLGSKGDKGEIGAGERGPIGPSGPSGERGQPGLRGLPGKVGPRGPVGSAGPVGPKGSKGSIGPVGPSGSQGPKGDKGSIGETVATGRIRESAFSVYKTSNQVTTSLNEIVTFDGAHVNIGGHFNLARNRFICQIPGTYVFSYSAHVTEADANDNPDLRLYKDGQMMAEARTEIGNIQIAHSVILELQNGNEVWLQLGSEGEGVSSSSSFKRCIFSGFLLYEH